MIIVLQKPEIEKLVKHAKDIVVYYNGIRGGKVYDHNKVGSNIIGAKAEVAALKWLSEVVRYPELLKNNFVDFGPQSKGKSDITYGSLNFEIKGLNSIHWEKLGRMIPPKHCESYLKSKAIIIWATATPEEEDCEVILKGWNTAQDVKDHHVKVQTICENLWIQDESLMRNMSLLAEVVSASVD